MASEKESLISSTNANVTVSYCSNDKGDNNDKDQRLIISSQEGDDDTFRKSNNNNRCISVKDACCVFFVKNYLPIVLIFAVVFGALVPQPGVFFNYRETFYTCVAILFLYVGLYLRTADIKEAMKAYKAYLWGVFTILVVTSIIGGELTNLLEFDDLNAHKAKPTDGGNSSVNNGTVVGPVKKNTLGPFEAKVALIMYHIMPCTIGTGIIMVMTLGGHAALGILITVFCNVIGIFTIPLYLKWLVFSKVDVHFDLGDMMLKLFYTLFIPLFVGKIINFNKHVHRFINVPSRKTKIKMFVFSDIAFILLIKTSQSSYDGELKRLSPVGIVFILGWTLVLHIIFLLVNTIATFILRLPLDQKKCVIILASQKTLSQAIAASVFLPEGVGDPGLIAVCMVFCHITVLVFDSVLIPVWLHVERWNATRYKRLKEEDVEDVKDTEEYSTVVKEKERFSGESEEDSGEEMNFGEKENVRTKKKRKTYRKNRDDYEKIL